MHRSGPFALLLVLLAPAGAHAQAPPCRTRAQLIAAHALIPSYDLGRRDDISLSNLMLGTYAGDRTSSYIGLGPLEHTVTSQDATVPLQDGEGRLGYRFEANVDLFFTVISGRNDPHFFSAGNRIGIFFNNTVRMARDPSSPLLPGNWKIGAAGEFPILLSGFRRRNNHNVKWTVRRDRVIRSSLKHHRDDPVCAQRYTDADHAIISALRARNDLVARDNLRRSLFVYGTWQVLHYSNGQDTGFYDNKALLRNDYNSGDFSTNYVQVKVNLAWRYVRRSDRHGTNLLTVGAGIRRDIGSYDGTFAYSAEQEHSYGRARFVGHAQWRSRPLWTGTYIHRPYREPGCTQPHRLRECSEVRVRAEVDGLLHTRSGLGNYPHAKKYRWGGHLWLELNTLRSHSTGFFVHLYHGRDYLNIRYDRAVWLFMGGLSFTIDKYVPFGWRAAETIVP